MCEEVSTRRAGHLGIGLTQCSFCRKTTMVKHQRRSHQRGAHPGDIDDGETSGSESGDSPSTPQNSGMPWPQTIQIPHNVHPAAQPLHRARSYNDFNPPQYDGVPVQQYGHVHHRHTLSAGQPYQGQVQENHPVPIINRGPNIPGHSSYYLPEQNNPGVATLTPIQTYQLPRQIMDRSGSVQSSPSTYSSISRASPVSQEPYYTHQPAQSTTYALQHSPVGQQPIIQYHQVHHPLPQQIPQQHSIPAAPQPHPTHQPQPQYQQAPQNGQWYESVPYQSPVEIISHIQAYPQSQVYNDPWIQKIDTYDDPSLQMPSARIENL